MPGWERVGGVVAAPECQNIVYDPLYGVRVCADTGEVLEEAVADEGAEWRAYTPEERAERPRAGSPVRSSRADMGVGASLGGLNKPGAVRARGVRRPGVAGGGAKPKLAEAAGRGLRRGLRLVSDLCRALGLTWRACEEAARIYRGAVERGLACGRPVEAVAAASAYLACRAAGGHVELGRLAEALCDLEPDLAYRKRSDVRHEVRRAVKILARGLGVKPKPVKPEDLVPALASSLDLPASSIAEAVKTLEAARRRGLHSGRHPTALAAAALYVASNGRVSLRALARATGLAEATIRARAREMRGARGEQEAGGDAAAPPPPATGRGG
jgi:transcription initiation factor TFIIB